MLKVWAGKIPLSKIVPPAPPVLIHGNLAALLVKLGNRIFSKFCASYVAMKYGKDYE